MLSRGPHADRVRRIVGYLIIVLVPVLIAVLTIRPGAGGDTQTVRVTFDELNGLAKVNRDVRIGGVNVGEITGATRVGNDAELTLTIEAGAGPVYQDATAELRPHAAFEGDAFVDLDPGTPGAGELGERAIPKAQTSVYVPLDRALRVLDRPRRDAVQKVGAELATASTPAAERGLQDTLRELPAAARGARTAMRAAQGPEGDDLRAIIRDLGVTMPELGRRGPKLRALLRDTRRTLAAVRTQEGQPLDATLVALPGAVAQLRDGARELPGMFSRIGVTATRLEPTLVELDPTLRALRPLLRETAPTLVGTPQLTRDLQLVLDDLARATPATRALVAEVLPVVVQIEDEVVPRVTKPTRMTQRPAYQALLSALTGLSGAMTRYHPEGVRPYSGAGHYWRVVTDLQQAVDGGAPLGSVVRDAAGCRPAVRGEGAGCE